MPTRKEQLEQQWAETNRRIAEMLAAGQIGWDDECELQGQLDEIEYEASLEYLKTRDLQP